MFKNLFPRHTGHSGKWCLLACGLTFTLSPVLANAQSKVVLYPIAPIGEGVDEGLINDITNSLFGEIDIRKSFQMVEGQEQASAATTATTADAVAPAPDLGSPEGYLQAMKLLSQGDAATQRNRWEQAKTNLEDAIHLFENNLNFLEDVSKLEEAYFTLAVSYIRLGRENESTAYLEKVLAIHPNRTLDAGKYPNYFRSIFENVRKNLKTQGRGTLQVNSAAKGATVYLDGQESGTIPATINNVISGQHILRVVAGSQIWSGLIQVKGQGVTTQNVPLEGTAATASTATDTPTGPFIQPAINANSFSPEAQKAAIDSANAVNAEFALVGGVALKDNQLLMPIFICDTKQNKCDRLMQAKLDMDLNALDQEAPRFADLLAKKAQSVSGEVQGTVPFIGEENNEESAAPVVAPVVVVAPAEELAPVEPAPVDEPIAPAVEDLPAEPEPVLTVVEPAVPENSDILQAGPVDLDKNGNKKKPLYKQGWFWTVTGIVVVGAATGITMGVLASQGKFKDSTTIRMVW